MNGLGACWGRGGHAFFPWRWVKKRQRYESHCRHCGELRTATAEEYEGVS